MFRAQCPPVNLSELLSSAGCVAHMTGPDNTVTGLSQDSRHVAPGDVYVCVRGESFNGHMFIGDAIHAGAVAVRVDEDVVINKDDVAVVRVDNVRAAIGALASAAFGHPSQQLTMVGVTGTTGKTSTTSMIGAICTASGRPTQVIGTLTNVRTTPEAIELQAQLHECVNSGVSTVVMEVSSHSIAMHRVDGITFDIAVFTNIGRDHLDFHGTEEAYFAAKAQLFSPARAHRGVVNGDDVKGQLLCDVAAIPMTAFHRSDAVVREIAVDHIEFEWRNMEMRVPMGGEFTLMNALAAATTADQLGISAADIQNGFAQMRPVPGRYEPVENSRGLGIVVDYAHTPESLKALLESVRPLCRGDVIVVFGCGGNRDAGKRPLMGAVAAECADVVVVTSDNPRDEDPQQIVDDVCAGIPDGFDRVFRVLHREEAITSAISRAGRDDIVVIAGKGHEATQEIKGQLYPFNDVDVAKRAAESGEEVNS